MGDNEKTLDELRAEAQGKTPEEMTIHELEAQYVTRGFLHRILSQFFIFPVQKTVPKPDELKHGHSVDVDLFHGQLSPSNPKTDERRRYTKSGDDLYWVKMHKV